jgi:hypothetical protein
VPAGLPDPLLFADGHRHVSSVEDWSARRAEILDLFRDEVYGRAPGLPEQLSFSVVEENRAAIDGRATLRRVAITSRQAGRELTFELIVFVPNDKPRAGAFMLINHRPASNTDPTRATVSPFWPVQQIVARGYAVAAIQTSVLAPDDAATYASGAIRLFEGDSTAQRPPNAWKSIAAWSWGASRALDYLVTDSSIDPARVAWLRGGRAQPPSGWRDGGRRQSRLSALVRRQLP